MAQGGTRNVDTGTMTPDDFPRQLSQLAERLPTQFAARATWSNKVADHPTKVLR